jgi:hypothetical protein
MTTPDARKQLVSNALTLLARKQHFIYSEAGNRMTFEHQSPIAWPVTTDCSGFVTLCCYTAGMADPNGVNYSGNGYTGTLLSHNPHITAAQVVPGDAVVYGPGAGWHTAIVVEVHGPDILTVSHGQQGDPSLVWVNAPKTVPANGHPVDGRQPQTFIRFNTAQVRPPVSIPAA